MSQSSRPGIDTDQVQARIEAEDQARLAAYDAHPFVTAGTKFENARTADDKDQAVRAMLENAQVFESLYNPAADASRRDHDRETLNALDRRMLEFDPNTQRVMGAVRRAALGVGALKAGDDKTYAGLFNKLIENIDDEADPDLFAASGLAMEHMTLPHAARHGMALGDLMVYAATLNASKNSANFARESDDMTNQEEAISLMRQAVKLSAEGLKAGRLVEGAFLTALSSKYNMIYLNGETPQKGDEAVGHEKEQDEKSDPLFKEAIFVINRAEIENFHKKQLAVHSAVLKP